MVGTPMITTWVKITLSQPIGARVLCTGSERAGESPPPEVRCRRSSSSGGRSGSGQAARASELASAWLFRDLAKVNSSGARDAGSCVPLDPAQEGLEGK